MNDAVTLAWPQRALWANSRVHFMRKAAAVKRARQEAGWCTKVAGLTAPTKGVIRLRIDCYPPTARTPDQDNMLAALKASLDGIADALRVDDRRFRPRVYIHDVEPARRGQVVVSIISERAFISVTLPNGETRMIPADILEEYE